MNASTAPRRRRLIQALALLGLAVLAFFLWKPLAAGTGAPATEPSSQQSLPPFQLPGPALEYVRAAFQAYEPTRALLARDTVEGLSPRAGEIAAALRAAADEVGSQRTDVADFLRKGAEAASRLGMAKDVAQARKHFAGVSQSLVSLAASDARIRDDWNLFECPMAEGFNKWFQREPRLDNPYMGQRMAACGAPSEWSVPVPVPAHEGQAHGNGAVAHYTCPMHPAVRQAGPGQCPICGMDLTPVTRADVESGVIVVDDVRRQRIGVKTARVEMMPMDLSIRALGRVTYDEKALVDVTLKLDGYIHELRVNATGEPVKKGDVLFTLYSPELYAAQQEYLLASKSQSAANSSLVGASRKRLELWGLTPAQVERVARRGEPIENMPFLSPASGYVLEKNVVEGAAVKAGERLFRIAPLAKVWVEADVYEQDLPQVKVGQPVEVTLPYLPGKQYAGRVGYIYPALQGNTRTGRIRIELPNPGLELKPDMYADVRFVVRGGQRLQVPETAVIYTGPRRLVFVDLGEGRLKPQEVKLGLRGEDTYEVIEGLKAGDVVVTSGNFLIAAESRLRSAADTFGGGGEHAAH
ncbi:efflux RND transporter periplasmic adaptor subunit [Pyxidicoccus parkwayensis]|uniref:Efflux RND transporter periplasmic adaptor subunit n=1 Tax=Pyxidicoccus parkwayensis TaxID=2813578 RepID=A0ABX7NXX0_9BACT|nr:efflux RND transporter periplasmic adaptor subunit [Pyxidicoccus parkwaysis]QSQ23742.1 efflux RND transporter periplasmic adaptor subunit [Pyxidicoccus parkwaysis]